MEPIPIGGIGRGIACCIPGVDGGGRVMPGRLPYVALCIGAADCIGAPILAAGGDRGREKRGCARKRSVLRNRRLDFSEDLRHYENVFIEKKHHF